MMQPYRNLFPHAGLTLQHTRAVAERVIVLPNGTALPEGAIETITALCRTMGNGNA